MAKIEKPLAEQLPTDDQSQEARITISQLLKQVATLEAESLTESQQVLVNELQQVLLPC